MSCSKSNKKRSLSSSKKSIQANKLLKSQLSKIFEISNSKKTKTQRKSSKLKFNARQKQNKKIDTSDYDFPEFTISFNEDCKNQVFKHAVIDSNGSKLLKTQRSQLKNKKSSKRYINKNTSLLQISEDCNKIVHSAERKIEDISCKQNNRSLEDQYSNCVQKLFKLLDIFNRGKISEINLNKWIPQPALYFLGQVFQRIRVQKLTLTQQQFIQLCMPLLKDSTVEDIKWFIDKTNSLTHLKQSINISQIKNSQFSPIERRIMQQELLKSHSKRKNQFNNIQLPYVIDMIKKKELQVSQKLQQINQRMKYKHFNPLQQINQNKCQKFTGHSNPRLKEFQIQNIKVSTFRQEQTNNQPTKKSIVKKSANYLEEPEVLRKIKIDNIKIQDIQNPYIANFTFQLPQITEVVSEKESLNGLQQKLSGNIQRNFKVKYQKSQSSQIGEHISARYLSKSIEDVKYALKSSRNNLNQNADEDNRRLDHLNQRIQNFLKINSEKIQKNKSFFVQNNGKRLVK